MIKEETLKNYYENPNYCQNCGEIIKVNENQPLYETKRKKFCNLSCAASFNNKGKVKNPSGNNGLVPVLKEKDEKILKQSDIAKICPICGNSKNYRAKICKDCYHSQIDIGNNTLGFYIADKKYLTSKCQEIRRHARKIIEKSPRDKVCAYCKDIQFNEILEVHHIKGILEFSQDTLLKDINNEDNLIWLCPNHHAMLEKNLIKI